MNNYEQLLERTANERAALLNQPVLQQVAEGDFDALTYQRFLTNAFHHVRHTVPLMMLTGARLKPCQSWLQPLLKEYIEEETGHERWILGDIGAAGGDIEATADSTPWFEVDVLVRFVRDYIEQEEAVGFFGMVLVLEGTSTTLASATADRVQELLGLPDAAFTYLRSHGDLDQDHIQFFESLVNRLTPEELEHVERVAKAVYRLYGDVLNSAGTGPH